MLTLLRSLLVAVLLIAGPAMAQEAAPEPAPAAEPTPGDEAATPAEQAGEGEPAPAPEPQLSPEELANKQRANELSAEATELFQKELYNSAVEMFLKAYALDPQLVFVYNIGVCYERLGDSDNCVQYYEKYLDQFSAENDGKSPEDVVDVRNSIAKCRLGAKVEVTIESDPPGASVSIDQQDTMLGQTPLTTRQDPGTYTLFVDMPGHQPIKRQVEIRTGEAVRLLFKLVKIERTGTVSVRANIRGATIFVDGRNIGLTPYDDPIRVDEGPHQITISKDEYTTFSEEFVVKAGDDQQLSAELWLRDPPTTWKGYVGWTGVGLGSGLIIGGFFAGQEAAKYYDESSYKVRGLLGETLETRRTPATPEFTQYKLLEQVGYWTGGVLMGLGVTLVILEAVDVYMVKEKDELEAETAWSDDIQILPVVTSLPGGGYAGAQIRF